MSDTTRNATASDAHQNLLNQLAWALETQRDVKITALDLAGNPEPLAQKYHGLSKPDLYGDHRPDLVGIDGSGTTHLGEAETDMNAKNLDKQLKAFANRVLDYTKPPARLHVIVPQGIWQAMGDRIRSCGFGRMLEDGRISLWRVKDQSDA